MCITGALNCRVCGRPVCDFHLGIKGPLHTEPEEVEAYCEEHLPERDVVVFRFATRKEIRQIRDPMERRLALHCEERQGLAGRAVGIRPLTRNAFENTVLREDLNIPNTWIPFRREVRGPFSGFLSNPPRSEVDEK